MSLHMRSAKRTLLTWTGMFFLVIVPMFLIFSAHIRKGLPDSAYMVTGVTGKAYARYSITHTPTAKRNAASLPYSRQSGWLPLRPGMRIGPSATIKTEADSSAEIMKTGLFALKIEARSLIEFPNNAENPKRHLVINRDGRLLCNVRPAEDRDEKNAIVVQTEDVSVAVTGTVFSVNYSQERTSTDISVMRGAVNITSKNGKQKLTYPATSGQKVCYQSGCRLPVMRNIPAPEKQALEIAGALRLDYTQEEHWKKYLDLVTNSPLYRKALKLITDYELKIFKRAILYKAALLWNNTVPDSLTAIELDEGDYADPWNTDYYYEKLSPKSAVIISAGEDRILHSNDDIFVAIQL